jgi:hypothetical protein
MRGPASRSRTERPRRARGSPWIYPGLRQEHREAGSRQPRRFGRARRDGFGADDPGHRSPRTRRAAPGCVLECVSRTDLRPGVRRSAPDRDYHPTGRPPGPPPGTPRPPRRTKQNPNPNAGPGSFRCLATSHCAPGSARPAVRARQCAPGSARPAGFEPATRCLEGRFTQGSTCARPVGRPFALSVDDRWRPKCGPWSAEC